MIIRDSSKNAHDNMVFSGSASKSTFKSKVASQDSSDYITNLFVGELTPQMRC